MRYYTRHGPPAAHGPANKSTVAASGSRGLIGTIGAHTRLPGALGNKSLGGLRYVYKEGSAMTFDGEAFVQRFNTVWNGHDLEGILAMMTDDVVFEASFGKEP